MILVSVSYKYKKMIKAYHFLLLLSLFMCITTYIQAQVIIKGRIVTPAGIPVSSAPVVLQPTSKANILAYSMTSDEGRYEFSYNGKLDSLCITVSGFNIASQSKTIRAKTQTVDFKTEEKAIQLREVKVKSTKIWGAHDTINYLTSSFIDKKDLVIGDVLRKMPGIIIRENGEILYNGKPINKFYIENLDMLQGRYGIAINNITAKDVSTVQVLQNHQPIKALAKSQMSSDAAINLKLKDGAKGTFSIMTQLGIGASPLLGENELAGMYFAKERQNMCTYKENNSGVDLSNELRSFTGNDRISEGNMVNVQMPSTPAISQKRYLFNNSNATTINNLIKFKSGRQFTFNATYLNDRQTQQSTTRSSYYLPGDSVLRIDEKLNSVRNLNRLSTQLQYNINEETYYLNNDFNIQGSWEQSSGEIFNSQTIKQSLYHPSFFVSNNFNLVKKNKKDQGISFSSNNGYSTTQETLTLHPGLYSDIFTGGDPYNALEQQVRLNTFHSSNSLSLLSALVIGKFKFNPRIDYNIESQNLNSELSPLDGNGNVLHKTPDSLKNNLDWLKTDVRFSPDILYMKEYFSFYMAFPMSYKMLSLNNKIPGVKQNNDYLFFEPRVVIHYAINSNFYMEYEYSFNNQLGNIQSLYPGYILQSYRNINAFNNKLSKAKSNGGNISLSYKDLLPAIFIKIAVAYNHTKRDVLYGQDFNGIMNTTYSIGKGNISENRSISSTISKGFDFWNATFTLESMYGTYSSEQLRQNELINYKNEGWSSTGSLVMKPMRWISLSYKGTLGENWGKIEKGERFPSIRTTVNNINVNFYLPKDLNLSLNYEHYYNSAAQGNKYISFTDLGTWYTWKKMRISLDWTNIFNTKHYLTVYYTDISAYNNVYDIRPANILLKVKLKLK